MTQTLGRALALAAIVVLGASCSAGATSAHSGRATPAHPARATTTAPPAPATTTAPPATTTAPATSAPPVSTTTPGATATLHWSSCGSGFQCATLAVPLDYTHPAGPTIELALIRLRAGDPKQRTGSLLVNPGGPGASGVDFVRQSSDLFSADLRQHFDLVGFDPRGVGASSPVHCETGPELDTYIDVNPAPQDASGRQALVQADRRFVQGCVAMSGVSLLAHLSTADAARDMDRIRAALDEAKLTYLGFSYGTLLGATYAQEFPTRVRALALDGAIDPALTTEQEDLQQGVGFEQDLGDFLANCDTTPSCPLAGPGGARASFERALAAIRSGPPVPTASPSGRRLGPGEGYLGLAAGLYSRDTWPLLAQGLAGVLHGDGTVLLALSDAYSMRHPNGTYDNTIAANTAISCLDRPSPTQLSTYQADAVSFSRQAPTFGALEAWGPLPCAFWPVPPEGRPGALTAEGAPPIVVVGTTADPATPYAWAKALASQLRSGVLITHVGVGHTAYGDSSCVRQAVDAYLIHLTTPAPGLVCRQ